MDLLVSPFIAALLTKFTAVLIPATLLLWIMICRYLFRGRRALSYDTIIDWILKLYLLLMIGFIGFFPVMASVLGRIPISCFELYHLPNETL